MKAKDLIRLLDSLPMESETMLALSTDNIDELYELDGKWKNEGAQGDLFDITIEEPFPEFVLIYPRMTSPIRFNGKRKYHKEESIETISRYISKEFPGVPR